MEFRARYVRHGRLPSGWWRATAHQTSGADGELLAAAPEDADPGAAPDTVPGAVLWAVEPPDDDRDLARIVLTPELLPEAPPLWFVVVDEPRATPRAVNLVAYADPVLPPGTVVTRFRYGGLGVPNDRQVAAVRWYPEGGKVHQLFVAPAWRRRRVASALLYTADAVHQANGWPGHLHGDGRRTVLGQLLIESFRHPQRVAVLDRVMPPMDEPAGG